MARVTSKFQWSSFENLCFEENGFPTRQVINIDFDSDNLCDKNLQMIEVINSFAANYACDGRGKLFRRITRAARKANDPLKILK